MKQVYLDNNATTRLDPMVLEAMMPFLTDFYGNPSSIHDFGIPAQAALERAHQQAAALLGAEYPSEIIFTSCATEASATAIASAITLLPERREIITSAVEHPATLAACEHLESQGYLIHRIAVDSEGALDMAQYRAALGERGGPPRLERRMGGGQRGIDLVVGGIGKGGYGLPGVGIDRCVRHRAPSGPQQALVVGGSP